MASMIPKTGGDARPPSPPSAPPPPPPPLEQPRRAVVYDGDLWRLYVIVFVNLVLTILTLGLYRFWAKTRLRRYFWGHATVNQDRLEYAGTGNELLLGFLIVLFPILLPLFLFLGSSSLLLEGFAPNWAWVVEVSQPFLILFLIGIAIYRARYYRLTRTRWRGIRAGQSGSALRYGLMFVAAYLAAIFSVGWAWPWGQVWLHRYKMRHTWLGDRPFTFEGSAAGLYPSFLLAWTASVILPFLFLMVAGGIVAAFQGLDFLESMETLRPVAMTDDNDELSPWLAAVVVIGVIASSFVSLAAWQWYNAAKYRLFAGRTRLENLHFVLSLDGWSLAKFAMANMALLILTLGLAIPWIMHRRAKFFAPRLAVHGRLDMSSVGQSSRRPPETGEGLADAFDVGGI